MIKFFGVSEKTKAPFELDVTHLKVSLIEESSLFYDYFLKGYSMPFSFDIDSDFAKKMDFIADFNAVDYAVEVSGDLQIDDKFDIAVLKLKRQRGNKIEGRFYYGRQSFPLMSVKLAELGWPVISSTNLRDFAQAQLPKGYPTVDFNFPMVHHPNFSADHYGDYFLGYLNYNTGSFRINSYGYEDGEQVPRNYNAMTPMAYVLAILKRGFALENYNLLGQFVNHAAADKLMLFSEKHLLKYQSNLPDSFQFTGDGTQAWSGGITTATFGINQGMNIVGTYTVDCLLNLTDTYEEMYFTLSYDGVKLLSSNANFNQSVSLNIDDDNKNKNLLFSLTLKKRGDSTTRVENLAGQNLFRAEFLGGDLNIFPNTFSLAEVMPDMTFGTFLNKLKNFFNLDVRLEENKAILDFVEQNFANKVVHDESAFEIPKPERRYKKKQMYRLLAGQQEILVNDVGQVNSQTGFSDAEIVTINAGVQMMPVESTDQGFTAVKKDGTLDFQLLFYNGLQSNKPLAVQEVSGFRFNLQQVYELYWKKWLHFRLNAEFFKDKFKAGTFTEFDLEKLRYKYQRKHLYKKIKRTRIDSETWDIEIESETL